MGAATGSEDHFDMWSIYIYICIILYYKVSIYQFMRLDPIGLTNETQAQFLDRVDGPSEFDNIS